MSDAINVDSMGQVFARSTANAASQVVKMDFEQHAEIINDFLSVLWSAKLIKINDEMSDLEKIERGLFAVNLFLGSVAQVAVHEQLRNDKIESLTASLEAS